MCQENWEGSRKRNRRRSWREVDVCETGKTRPPLCLLQSRVCLFTAQFQKLKEKQNCLTILLGIRIWNVFFFSDRNLSSIANLGSSKQEPGRARNTARYRQDTKRPQKKERFTKWFENWSRMALELL
jgi:hypothetical protein